MPQSRYSHSSRSGGDARARRTLPCNTLFLVLLSALFGFATSTKAQTGQVAGVVVDQLTRQPVAAVAVQLGGTSREVVTDSVGRFLFSDLSAGRVTLRVRRLGYRDGDVDVWVTAGETIHLVVAVSETAIRLDSLAVEVLTTDERLLRGAGFGKNVLTRAEIELAEGSHMNLADLLRSHVPSVRVRRRERVVGTPICIELRTIRAFNTNQCLSPKVYLDGVPITSETWLYDNLDVSLIERMEVVPAAEAGARYGTGALYGALLIDTRRPGGSRAADAQLLRPRANFDWNNDAHGHRTGLVLISSAVGTGAGVALGLAIAKKCLRLRAPSNDGIVSDCSLGPTLATGAAAVLLPAIGSSIATRLAGQTEISRGQFLPATIGAAMAILPGYALAMSAKRNHDQSLEYVGYVLIGVGTPLITTTADYLFRKIRN